MNCIFLDVDGVLNNDRTSAIMPDGSTGLSDGLCKKLKSLKKSTNSTIILTSDIPQENKGYVMKKLRKFECMPLGYTFNRKNSMSKGGEVSMYIKDNEIENYVILDDCPDEFKNYDLMQRLVRIDFHEGITDADVAIAKRILGYET